MRLRLPLLLVMLMLSVGTIFASPPPGSSPRMSLNHPNVFMAPQISSPPIQFQNAGTPIGVSFTFNCSTGTSCSMVNGVLTITASGAGTVGNCATANALAKYTAATTTGCSLATDDGATLTYIGAGGIATGPDGVHPGNFGLVGNTTPAAVPSNTVNWMGPNATTFTAYALQLPITGPSTAAPLLSCVTPVGSVSACSFVASAGSGTVASCATTNALAIYTAATTTGCGNADFTFATHSLIGGTLGIVDLHLAGNAALVLPTGNCSALASGNYLTQRISDNNELCFVGGGVAFNMAIAATGAGTDVTTCVNQVVTAISGHANPTCTSLSAVTTADYTNATTTLSNVTGLALTLAANTRYAISCKLIYQGSATTASAVYASTGPASPTKVTAQLEAVTTAGAGAVLFTGATDGTTFGFSLGPSAIITTATDLNTTLDVGIRNGANAGTWQLQAKANGAGTITIRDGSFCTIQ